jgi:hypothetical protein
MKKFGLVLLLSSIILSGCGAAVAGVISFTSTSATVITVETAILTSAILVGASQTIGIQSEHQREIEGVMVYNAGLKASDHAIAAHAEAQSVIDCVQSKGAYLNYKLTRNPSGWYIPCQMDNGTISLAVFYDNEGGNATAFTPKDGTWASVKAYLDSLVKKGLAQVCKTKPKFLP